MKEIFAQLNIPINENLYLKDPAHSEIGNKIINGSISLIDKLGFESFTFKKLAIEIHTTEASIYRYFESKNKLLLYLVNWYWGCVATRLLFETKNIEDPIKKLKKAIHVLTAIPDPEKDIMLAKEQALKKIVINEAPKVLQTKSVDAENKFGVFALYKEIVKNVAAIITEINENYPYPNMLVSSMIEGSNQQRFFAEHLPKLTNVCDDINVVESFYMDLVLKTIKNGEK
jgi:AcrR family transcriptional regulator